jgi:vacuolar-type H+-ATPase subunit E/Vma4
MQLEKLKEAEEKVKEAQEKTQPIIQTIQEKIDESAKEMATRNAEHQKLIAELEVVLILRENFNQIIWYSRPKTWKKMQILLRK